MRKGRAVCSHETPYEARRCICTGYGLGDPACRCGYGKSQHLDGTGACVIVTARCHEFVLRLPADPLPVTAELVRAAGTAIVAQLGIPATQDMAERAALIAFTVGRAMTVQRDTELERARRARDDLRRQVAQMIAEKGTTV